MSHHVYPDTLAHDGDWMQHTACAADPDAMYPDSNEVGIAYAKSVCANCPVRLPCLQDAIRTGDNQHGIRGGLKPDERRKLAKDLTDGRAVLAEVPKPKAPRRPRPATLTEAFARRTKRTPDGHLRWNGSQPLMFSGERYTALQAAFVVGHGRKPEGPVRRTCGTDCFRADHLTDGRIRGRAPKCGTPAGARAHEDRGEDPCDACWSATAALVNQLAGAAS